MATELGQAYVQIMPSAKGISGMLKKQLDPEAESAGTSAGGKIGAGMKIAVAAGAAAAGAVMVKTISASLAEGAKLQQSLGGVETLFKSSADKVKDYANQAYRTAGLSANDYMENVTSFSASLLQSMGGNTAKAADKANMAMVDMSDNANKMGSNIGDIQNAYQGFAKQNYTMLDNLKLGYGGTQDEMKRLLTDATKITGVKYNMSNLSDVYSAIHAIQGKLNITGTTAKEAASTFSGSFDSMKAAASNVLGKLSLGMDIGPDLQALAGTVSTFLFQNFIPMVTNILKALPGAVVTFVQTAAPQFIAAGMKLLSQLSSGFTTGMPEFISRLGDIQFAIQEWLAAKLPTFLSAGVKILTNIANGIMQSLPQLISTASSMVIMFIGFLMQNLPKILNAGKDLLLGLVDGIIKNLPAIGKSAISAVARFLNVLEANYPKYAKSGMQILGQLVSGILQRLPKLISAVATLIKQFLAVVVQHLPQILVMGGKLLLSLIAGLIKSMPKLVGQVGKIGTSIINGLKKINLLDVGKNLIKGLWSGISNMAGWIISKIQGFGKGVLGSLKSFFKIHSPSRVMRDEIGRYLVEGLGVGIERYAGSAYDAMQSLGAGIQDRVPSLNMDYGTTGSLATSAVQQLSFRAASATYQAASSGAASASTTGDVLELHVDANIDGKKVSREIAPVIRVDIDRLKRLKNRAGGIR
ncbi:phage tail protein [Lacticaseibacillus absianus]|uniref:phage tail protein n=1 Tax=Lacticaseibacillus absianus TaxID=2729623 RepID=UPI0015CCAA72|nr:hypothetical protein [Lacticaseibacillus absianus]